VVIVVVIIAMVKHKWLLDNLLFLYVIV